jgi:hypothetical protein
MPRFIAGRFFLRDRFLDAIVIVAAVVKAPALYAGITVYKCVKEGHTVLTEKPCETSNSKESTDQSTANSTATMVLSNTTPAWPAWIRAQSMSCG